MKKILTLFLILLFAISLSNVSTVRAGFKYDNARFIPREALVNEAGQLSTDPYRLYTYLSTRDLSQPNGVSGNIWLYDNEINSGVKSAFIAFFLSLVRDTEYAYEFFEVGYYQDTFGCFFFTAYYINGHYSEQRHFTALPESRSYNVEIIEQNGRFVAYIDHKAYQNVAFSDKVITEDRYYSAQGESNSPSNELRGHFWNLMYQDSSRNWHPWNTIVVYQDRPYYTRLGSKDEYYSTILGDVNLDYHVNLADVTEINVHWFECLTFDDGYTVYVVGIEGYADHADINHDGWVDLFDMGAINAYYNWEW